MTDEEKQHFKRLGNMLGSRGAITALGEIVTNKSSDERDLETADSLAVDSRIDSLSCTGLADRIYKALRSARDEGWNEAIEAAAIRASDHVDLEHDDVCIIEDVIRSLKKSPASEEGK